MGRKEERIKAQHEVIAELASDLPKLRADAGGPTYRSMAARTHYAASTLSRAASGSGLPNADVLLAYVAACGGDQTEWTRRWEHANAAVQPPPQVGKTAPALTADAAPQPRARPRSHRRGDGIAMAALLGAALLAIAAAFITLGAQDMPKPIKARIPSAILSVPATATISDGDDPQTDKCASANDVQASALGATMVVIRTIRTQAGTVIGWLGLWRNARCHAEWAEASYVDPHLYPVTLEAHRPADGAAVVDHFVVNLPRDPAIGHLLTTAPGCIWGRMRLAIPHAPPLVVQTPCR